jgi:DNA-binding transcriptional MerR regulator
MNTGEPRWTIAELGERVSAALAEVEYEAPANGQVRAVPDLRTIRYYTSLGLLDRPAAMQGRTALYGRRHLLQLVAVKRLQAQGKSLSEVQAALTGLDDGALADIAAVPDSAARDEAPSHAEAAAESPRRDARFWAAAPARARVEPARRARPLTMMARIDLAPGVSLVVEVAGSSGAFHGLASSIDPAELARAAAPLLEALHRHGLANEDHEEEERG